MPAGFFSKAALKVIKGGKKNKFPEGTEVRLKKGINIEEENSKAVDNINVVNSLVCNQASMIMTSGELKREGMSFTDEGVSGINSINFFNVGSR